MAITTFDYSSVPLNPSVAQIRLLRLEHQDSDADHIRCELKVHWLAYPPPFVALSYVWGDPADPVTITCNDSGSVSISRNLHKVLKWLQHTQQHEAAAYKQCDQYSQTVRWIWVDAVCINQDDLEERRTQVLLMRRIYEQATKTNIWLGEAESVAIKLIQSMDRARRLYEAAGDERNFSSMSLADREKYGLPDRNDAESFVALDKFMSGGWFSRIWIMQELAVSAQPIMLTKDFVLSWGDFADTIMFMYTLQIPLQVYGQSAALSTALSVTRDRVRKKQTLPLLHLLLSTSEMLATDPRDRIYGLLGISEGPGSEIQPDYTKSVEELYMDLQKRMLRGRSEERYLDALNVPRQPDESPSIGSTNANTAHLPSWVTDWRGKVSSTQTPFFPSTFTNQPFFANFAAAPKISGEDEDSDDLLFQGDLIRLQGIRLSHIEANGSVHILSARASGAMDKMRAIGKEAASWRADEHLCRVRSNKTYARTGESMRDVYWQTCCAGQHFKDYAETKAGFEKWYAVVRAPMRFLPAPSHPLLVKMNLRWLNLLSANALKQLPTLRASDDFTHFNWASTMSSGSRRLFRTKDQCIGVGPPEMEKGDVVFLLKGSRTPMLLRRSEKAEQWRLIGACYLHGFMDGKAFDEKRCSDVWLV